MLLFRQVDRPLSGFPYTANTEKCHTGEMNTLSHSLMEMPSLLHFGSWVWIGKSSKCQIVHKPRNNQSRTGSDQEKGSGNSHAGYVAEWSKQQKSRQLQTYHLGYLLPFAASCKDVCFADKPAFCLCSHCRRSISSHVQRRAFGSEAGFTEPAIQSDETRYDQPFAA